MILMHFLDMEFMCRQNPELALRIGTVYGLVLADFQDWIKDETAIELKVTTSIRTASKSPPALLQLVVPKPVLIKAVPFWLCLILTR